MSSLGSVCLQFFVAYTIWGFCEKKQGFLLKKNTGLKVTQPHVAPGVLDAHNLDPV